MQMNKMIATSINQRLRLWWFRRGLRLVVVISGAVLLISLLIILNPNSSVSLEANTDNLVDLTLVRNATLKGALCLDGSRPGYHIQRGFGSGVSSWLLHIEGGGWCNSAESCSSRAETLLGSSHFMEQVAFVGILSQTEPENPDFYNWNRVKIRYCEGGSFSGETEVHTMTGQNLLFRGQRIWEAVVDELLSQGLKNAKQAFLTGCSAGGLTTFIHCDSFRALLPKAATIKCLADAGFFLDEKDISGKRTMQSFYDEVVHLQDIGKFLPKDCTNKMEPSQCFFPHELMKGIKTPFFILNAAYDWWQIKNILVPKSSDPQGKWLRCRNNLFSCDSKQLKMLNDYRSSMLKTISKSLHKKDDGMFINSCFAHCQTMSSLTWHSPNSPRISNKVGKPGGPVKPPLFHLTGQRGTDRVRFTQRVDMVSSSSGFTPIRIAAADGPRTRTALTECKIFDH